MNTVLLTLIAPRPIEEDIMDLLLANPELAPGFTSTPCSGHGSAVAFIGVAEHVSGRADRVRIELLTQPEQARAVLAMVKAQLSNANIFYWLSPVLESGRCA